MSALSGVAGADGLDLGDERVEEVADDARSASTRWTEMQT